MTREEAIEIVKTQYSHDSVMKTALGTLIPELCENSDEIIRSAMIKGFNFLMEKREINTFAGTPIRNILAYLEKQKELSELEKYITDKRSTIGFYCNHKEVSWNEIPLEDRKRDYPYYFDEDIDCYPFVAQKQKTMDKQDLSGLSDFESEKPTKGLEEEIQKYLESKGVGYGGWIDGWKDEDLREIARHFFSLGLNARKT